ncbi:branched-chain amino acid ABC transporter permease [Vagococcus salmoninarum]|uniref:Branched-chain amino acid ABC transporter permease n=1 Tax=Vagococcus salmoninarum TaxID=2739 RepID=A0A429ZW13_9ENTE|nr:branched-chain amino acid ABC transporter permease [Vagococcus salmoninarum]RST97836.1 branched-chain amino acid ABC transporter permease [Vagococcus salmoninarum]
MSELIGIILRSIEYGSFYALSALSIILVYKTSYTTNFAQATLGMFNTYLVATIIHKFGWSLYAALPIGILSSIVIGILIDVLIIRRAKDASPVSKQIITLGLISVFLGIAPLIFGVYNLNMPQFISKGKLSVLGATISYNALFNIILGMTVMIGMFTIIQRTKLGLAIRTTASNPVTARLMGVPTKTITMLAWSVAGVLSLLSGVMTAPYSSVSLTFMNDVQITAFLAAVVGGFSSFHGPVICAYFISIAMNLLQVYLPAGTVWGKPILYIILLLVMYFKPYGVFGTKIVKKV